MKNSILLFAFSAFSLLSCSDDSDSNASIDTTQLVGTWMLESATINGEEVGSSYKIQFTSTGRAKFYYRNPISNTTFGPDVIENGDYSIISNSIRVTWDVSDPGNETSTFQLLELTSSKLKYKSNSDGEILTEVYTR